MVAVMTVGTTGVVIGSAVTRGHGSATLDGSTSYATWSSRSGSLYTMTRDAFLTALTVQIGCDPRHERLHPVRSGDDRELGHHLPHPEQRGQRRVWRGHPSREVGRGRVGQGRRPDLFIRLRDCYIELLGGVW